VLRFCKHKYTERVRVYQAPAAACNACLLKAQCTTSAKGRQIKRSFDEAYLDRVRTYHATEAYAKAMRKRQVWVEPLFAEAKLWHGLSRFRLRGLPKGQQRGPADRGRTESEATAQPLGVGTAPVPERVAGSRPPAALGQSHPRTMTAVFLPDRCGRRHGTGPRTPFFNTLRCYRTHHGRWERMGRARHPA
jgi:hypothetical protein